MTELRLTSQIWNKRYFSLSQKGWLNTRLHYSLDLELTCVCFIYLFIVFQY